MHSKTLVAPLLGLIVLVAGCASNGVSDRVDRRLAKAADDEPRLAGQSLIEKVTPETRGSSQYADTAAVRQATLPTMRRSGSTWIGGHMVPVTREDQLPSVFGMDYTFNFQDSGGVSIATLASRLSTLTKVPVRISPDVYSLRVALAAASPKAAVMGNGVPAVAGSNGGPLPQAGAAPRASQSQDDAGSLSGAGAITIDSVEARWKGTLTGFLNHVTDRLGLAWEYRDGAVIIQRFVTDSFEVAALPGVNGFAFGGSGNTGGSGGNSALNSSSTMQITDKGSLDAISSVERAVNSMLATVPGSSLARVEGSGRMLVTTTKEMLSKVRDFIEGENAAMLRQAQIQFDVYSVRTADSGSAGVDWTVVFKALSKNYGLGLTSPGSLVPSGAGQLALNILSPLTSGSTDPTWTSSHFGNSSAFISALSELGDNVQHRPVSLLALNRAFATAGQTNQQVYLSETVPGAASTLGAGAPGLKTSSFSTGDSYAVLPQILQDNSVLLKFGINLADLISLADITSGSGSTLQRVQAPQIAAISQQSAVRLRAGELMVITGLSRVVAGADKRTLADGLPILTGGSSTKKETREHFLIVVRPVLL